MQPLFTIHAGEYLVADHIERTFRNTRVWIPTKDTGIDLLVTDRAMRRTLSLQVKYSRDYLVTHLPASHQSRPRACGWWTFDEEKLRDSPADFWVLLLVGFDNRSRDHIVIAPRELHERVTRLGTTTRPQSKLWVTKEHRCWEVHGLGKAAQSELVNGALDDPPRELTVYLNQWPAVAALNK
jgi:hypothetical protein